MKNIKKKAQSLIEYGLILALVAIIALTVLGKFGKSITNVGDKASNSVNTAGNNAQNNYCKSVDATKPIYNEQTGECGAAAAPAPPAGP